MPLSALPSAHTCFVCPYMPCSGSACLRADPIRMASAERARGGVSLWSLARGDEVAHRLALPSCLHRAQALHPCERIPDRLAWRESATDLFSTEAFGMLSQERQDLLPHGAARPATFACWC